jgi:hypothetical protein
MLDAFSRRYYPPDMIVRWHAHEVWFVGAKGIMESHGHHIHKFRDCKAEAWSHLYIAVIMESPQSNI